jgi:hypothetical protein
LLPALWPASLSNKTKQTKGAFGLLFCEKRMPSYDRSPLLQKDYACQEAARFRE